jgi:hypothetical protein
MSRVENWVMIACLAATSIAWAQGGATDNLPDAPQGKFPAQAGVAAAPNSTAAVQAAKVDLSSSAVYRLGAMCGTGASQSTAGVKPSGGCGVGMTLIPLPVYIEIGMMGPQANRSNFTGYVSADTSIVLNRAAKRYVPMAMLGYSRLFETGHALDYGLAIALPRLGKQKNTGDSMRIEIRDYWTFANPAQHNVMLRFGWVAEETD